MWRWLAIVFGLGFATAVAGELKISPFVDSFRVSLGSAVFFFLILFYKPLLLSLVGVLVGLMVCLFRVGVDLAMDGSADWLTSWTTHAPAVFYYVTFAILLSFAGFARFTSAPLMLGIIGACVDSMSNLVELLARMVIEQHALQVGTQVPVIATVGILRSFLIVGLYSMVEIRQLQAVSRVQQSRMEKLLLILSELHEGRLYLQKMMDQVEHITAQSYQLYRNLAGSAHAGEALQLTEEVHEVKKDAQRIVASLSKLLKQEKVANQLTIHEAVQLVVKANSKYAELLGKTIEIRAQIKVEWETKSYISLLSFLNNLVCNAVEAITRTGKVLIDVYPLGNRLRIDIHDTGPGIDGKDRQLVFEPGFTTKFDRSGNASTGIGLSHVLRTLQELDGVIELGDSPLGGALFQITIPYQNLQQEYQSCRTKTG